MSCLMETGWVHSKGTVALTLDELLVPTKLYLTAARWDKN